MTSWRPAEEVEADYRAAMGVELAPLFHALYLELTWTHWRWKQYRVLFGENESRIALLNEAAPLFFGIVQDVFFEDTLLAIARLTGPAQTLNKPNLSVERLPALMKTPELGDQIQKMVTDAQMVAAFAKDWRNRHIAHRDLRLILGGAERPLEPASRETVENALRALRNLMNAVESAYRDSTTAYDLVPSAEDAESLLYVVRDGLRFEREKRALWDRGELHNEDLNPPPAV
jgi:hypothetical protein